VSSGFTSAACKSQSDGGQRWAGQQPIGLPQQTTSCGCFPFGQKQSYPYLAGFGTTLVALPVIAHVVSLSTAVPAIALTDSAAAIGNGLRMNAEVQRAEVKRLLLPMAGGSAVGAWILLAVPVRTLMLALGVFVLLYA
jgi:hypothetical protein